MYISGTKKEKANQEVKTKTNKLYTTVMENSIFDFDKLPGISRFLIQCTDS